MKHGILNNGDKVFVKGSDVKYYVKEVISKFLVKLEYKEDGEMFSGSVIDVSLIEKR